MKFATARGIAVKRRSFLEQMNNQNRFILIIAVAVLAGCSAGCGKKAGTGGAAAPAATAEAGSVSASKLPGANDALAALDKKDYDGVIAGVMRVRQSVASAEQQAEFTVLVDEVKIRLLDSAPSDPKAAEALTALRRITGGR